MQTTPASILPHEETKHMNIHNTTCNNHNNYTKEQWMSHLPGTCPWTLQCAARTIPCRCRWQPTSTLARYITTTKKQDWTINRYNKNMNNKNMKNISRRNLLISIYFHYIFTCTDIPTTAQTPTDQLLVSNWRTLSTFTRKPLQNTSTNDTFRLLWCPLNSTHCSRHSYQIYFLSR